MSINKALNSSNDIFLLDSRIAQVRGGAQVVQLVRSRLLFYQGEAILDTTVGVPWLQQILGKPFDLGLAESLIKAEIIQTEGVESLNTFELDFNNIARKLTVSFTATTTFGEIIEDELYINV